MSESRPLRVLVVDDEPNTWSDLSDILNNLGYHPDVAYDEPSALDLVRRNHYDVALLDSRMPGMNGLTLYREIRKVRAGTVAILVTAYSGGTTTQDALQAGLWRVLPKPVDLPKLLGVIETACRQALVLVVDDDSDLCENLWQILRDHGYRVALAHDVPCAAEQLREPTIEVALIDMKLPSGSGADAVRMLRESNLGARTIIVTGFRAETDAVIERVLPEGADATCYKPFDVPHRMDTLERLVGRR